MAEILPEKRIRWLPEYAVGVEEIDNEHQGLFSIAEDFRLALRAGEPADVLENLLARLMAYSDYHFLHEEALMERIGYPHIAEHRSEHSTLRARVLSLQQRAAAGETEMTVEAMRFLVEWLAGHTTTSDRRIGSYMRKHGLPA